MPARVSTYEYLRTPEVVSPQELIWGMVREAAAPTPRHQQAVGDFYFHLRQHLESPSGSSGLSGPRARSGRVWMAPIDVVLDPAEGLVVQPDVVVVLSSRLHLVTDRVWGAPDLVVAVMSPRPRIGSLDERLDSFARYGVRECWLVHEEERACEIVAFENAATASRRLFRAGDPLESAVLPGFRMALGDVLTGG